MADRRVVLNPSPSAPAGELRQAFAEIRARLGVPGEFPPEVVAEATAAAAAGPAEPPAVDATDIPFVTIDPPGSMDLDQALHIERAGGGWRVRYAIADVPAFVHPGGALDAETRRRAETIYLPDGTVPLHPRELSEGAASLLPDQVRSAFVWDMRVDADGVNTQATVARALVRSTARLDYDSVQADLDAGRAPEMLRLLSEVGEARVAQERARGGASLPKPEQEVIAEADGYRLRFRPPVRVEDDNAQISLLTGMAAAKMMLDGGIGLLRTMPGPDERLLARFRRQAAAMGVPWAPEKPYGEFLRALDRNDPRHLALMHAATSLFRGAGYTAFDGQPPTQCEHAALAAPYAHVTAPLRRLVDRFGLVTCCALAAGEPVPEWVRVALPVLPEIMRGSNRLSSAVERAATDAVEAAVLAPLVGHVWEATVVEDKGEKGCKVQITDPAVLGDCRTSAEAGRQVPVRLVSADVATGRVEFELLDAAGEAGGAR